MSDEQAGDAASAADAELAEDAFNVRADSRDLDLKPVRNLLVAEIVRDHARDFEFTHRKPQYRGAACLRRYRTACGADERTGERRLDQPQQLQDRKSTRLNSSHPSISYAVFCLKKKKKKKYILNILKKKKNKKKKKT